MRRWPSRLPFLYVLVLAFVLVAGLGLYANYQTYWSPEARLATRNSHAIRRIRVGMDTIQVRALMGLPRQVVSFEHPTPTRIYHYQHRPGTSDSYQIRFNSDHRVHDVLVVQDVE